MNILIVSSNREYAPFPVPPIGALFVAAALDKAGHQADVLDLAFVRSPSRALRSCFRKKNYHAIGLSIRNLDNCLFVRPKSYVPEVKEIAREIQSLTKAPLILGGSGFSVAPQGWLQLLKAPFGILGEGEIAFPALVESLEQGRSPASLPGVLCYENLLTGKEPFPQSPERFLRDFPQPAHHKCCYKPYLHRGGFVSIQTKRGCPMKCIYCVYPLLEGKTYRLRPPAQVAEEMERVIREQEGRYMFFTDSVFNSPREHALDVCRELIHRKVPCQWMAYCNPVGFDGELAQSMMRSGCIGIEFGLDSVTEKMIQLMGKPFNQADIRAGLHAAYQAQMPFAIHLLFGGPGETLDDVRESQDFLQSCDPAHAVFASIGIRIHAGTALEQISRKQGVLKDDSDLFHPVFYVSPGLGPAPARSLDRIARRRPEWTTPLDWSSLLVRCIQKILNRAGMRPQWRHISNYGKYMRRNDKKCYS